MSSGSAQAACKTRGTNAARIRPARSADAEVVAGLMAELGYPASVAEYRARIERLADRPGHCLIVAEEDSAAVIGCAHAFVRECVTADGEVEIGALVVAGRCRGRGIGQLLVKAVEQRARRAGCTGLRARMNVVREQTSRFYTSNGFAWTKTQHVWRKVI